MQFRPVMPQRRRTPSAGPSERTDKAESTPAAPATAPRVRPARPPVEMTASGPFALGPTEKTAPSGVRAAAQRPALAPKAGESSAGPKTVRRAPQVPAGDEDEDDTIDIHNVHELDEHAPQTLLKPPPQFKREPPQIKSEGGELDDVEMAEAQDVNEAQALDLSESEDEEGEEELAGRFVNSFQEGGSEGQTFLFQFPRPFPAFRTTAEPVAKPDASPDVVAVDAPDTASPPPPPAGEAGRLNIYRSGRVVLTLGDVPYEITDGCETSFLQQVMLLDAEQQRALCLGQLDAKLVATPDLAYLLARRE